MDLLHSEMGEVGGINLSLRIGKILHEVTWLAIQSQPQSHRIPISGGEAQESFSVRFPQGTLVRNTQEAQETVELLGWSLWAW